MMDSRALAAALLSSLDSVSGELLPLLLRLYPLFLGATGTHPTGSAAELAASLVLHHHLTSSHAAASFSLLSPRGPKRGRKRRRRRHDSPASQNMTQGDLFFPLLSGPDGAFKSQFRMTSATFQWLSGLLEPLLDCRDPAGSQLNLSPHLRLGIGLFRLATGSPHSDISRRFGVDESTSKFCARQLCRVLCTNFRFWLDFPTPTELLSVSAALQARTRGCFPNCCGVITCAHFDISKKPRCRSATAAAVTDDDDEDYGGQERGSIAAQLVVDSNCKILSIMARSCCSESDYHQHQGHGDADFDILKASSLYLDIQRGRLLKLDAPPLSPSPSSQGVVSATTGTIPQYLVGHGAYPLLPWLMVPFADPAEGSPAEDFNVAHRMMAARAAATVASLRSWGILRQPIEEESSLAVAYVGACAILHNMLLSREDDSAEVGVAVEAEVTREPQFWDTSSTSGALAIRRALAARAAQVRRSTRSSAQLQLQDVNLNHPPTTDTDES